MFPVNKKLDPGFWTLMVVNLLVAVYAIWDQWSLRELMWIYWGQSIIIGFFNLLRILALKNFSVANIRINGKPVKSPQNAKSFFAIFFVVHFGFFHFGYMIFLLAEGGEMLLNAFSYIALAWLAFAINHLISFLVNIKDDQEGGPNPAALFFLPYFRVAPMHMTIIFGAFIGAESTFAMIFFLALKTIADCRMHITEHSMLQKQAQVEEMIIR